MSKKVTHSQKWLILVAALLMIAWIPGSAGSTPRPTECGKDVIPTTTQPPDTVNPCQLIGGLIVSSLRPPGSPFVTPISTQGTPAGTAKWGYKITARSSVGETMASDEGTTTGGFETLTATNFNKIEWNGVAGALEYRIYRTTVPSLKSALIPTGLIGTTTSLSFNDTGPLEGLSSPPTVDTSGRVGIGTSGIPVGKLHVAGVEDVISPVVISSLSGSVRGVSLYLDSSGATGGRNYVILSTASGAGVGPGKFSIFDEAAGLPRLTIDSSGQVGIGTSVPDKTLHVLGSLRLQDCIIFEFPSCRDPVIIDITPVTSGPLGGRLSISSDVGLQALRVDEGNRNAGETTPGITFGSSDREGISSKRTAGGNQFGIDFYTAGTRRMGITNSGHVSIIGALNVDEADTNQGLEKVIGPGITFGKTSGEGISSKRTAGDNRFGLDFYTASVRRVSIANDGRLTVTGFASFEGGHGDLVENYYATDKLEGGDVVIIDPDHEMSLQLATKANDTHVAGIVSSQPSLKLKGRIDDSKGVPLALSGRVLCKIDASYGEIKPGDLLTTSPTPGHAMKAQPVTVDGVQMYLPGTIIGKALQEWKDGKGMIEVLVNLH